MEDFLHNLLSVMIDRHGAEEVRTRLTQLHAEMSLPKKKPSEDRDCSLCGGSLSGIGHYCM